MMFHSKLQTFLPFIVLGSTSAAGVGMKVLPDSVTIEGFAKQPDHRTLALSALTSMKSEGFFNKTGLLIGDHTPKSSRQKILMSAANHQGLPMNQKHLAADLFGQHRALQTGANHVVAYTATVLQLSSECSGWIPIVELGCQNGGDVDIVTVDSQLDTTATCSPHPTRGPSYVACSFPGVSEDEVFSDFVIYLSIDFICSSSSKAGVVGEATILPEFDLQCSSEAPEPQASAVSVDYFDFSTDPISTVEDFTCPEGDVLDLDGYSLCSSAIRCSSGSASCILPAASSVQRTPIPAMAFYSSSSVPAPSVPAVAPSPTPPTSSSATSVVGYEAIFGQISGDGCSGFRPIVEVSCTNGGQLDIVSVSSTESDPSCAVDSSDSSATCTFPTISEATVFNEGDFTVFMSIAFTCLGGGSLGQPVGEARFNEEVVECGSTALLYNSASVQYFDVRQSTFRSGFSCPDGEFRAAESSEFCFDTTLCSGGSCLTPVVTARQNSPIPAAAISTDAGSVPAPPAPRVPAPPAPRVPAPPAPRVPAPSPPTFPAFPQGPTTTASGSIGQGNTPSDRSPFEGSFFDRSDPFSAAASFSVAASLATTIAVGVGLVVGVFW